MFPVGRREVEVCQQPRHIREERRNSLRILPLIVLGEPLHSGLAARPALCIHHLMQGTFGLGLKPGRELVQHGGDAMHPAPLFPGLGPDLAHGSPEPKRPVANGQGWRPHAPSLNVPQHRQPTLCTLAIPVLNRDHLFGPIGADSNDD